MTETEIFEEITNCYNDQSSLDDFLAAFIEIAHNSPLTNPQEAALISNYEGCLVDIKGYYKRLIDSYVELYQDMQST